MFRWVKRLAIGMLAAATLAVAFVGGRSIAAPAPIPAQGAVVYSVKFLCGLQTTPSNAYRPPAEPIVKPGNYATVVNIQNFTDRPVTILKQPVLALPEGQQNQEQLTKPVSLTLGPSQTIEVDCNDIAKLLQTGSVLPQFIDGYLDVRSPRALSVTAAYTSQTCRNPGQVTSTGTGGCTDLGELALEVVPQQAFRLLPGA